jgi:universal stress protein A
MMSEYKNILLAIDLSEEADQVTAKAQSLATSNQAKLHIVHVIEPLSYAYGGDIPMDLSGVQKEIHKQAKTQLTEFSAKHGIDTDNQYIELGRPENEIHNLASQLEADLIIVGSHGRHGLALLLGSTANAVIHGAKCDVLAVRIND